MTAIVPNKVYIPLPATPTDELNILLAKLKLELSAISNVVEKSLIQIHLFSTKSVTNRLTYQNVYVKEHR